LICKSIGAVRFLRVFYTARRIPTPFLWAQTYSGGRSHQGLIALIGSTVAFLRLCARLEDKS